MGCFSLKEETPDFSLELIIAASVLEPGQCLTGEVRYDRKSEELLLPPRLMAVAEECVMRGTPRQRKQTFLEENIQLIGLPLRFELGEYKFSFSWRVPQTAPSSFKHHLADITFCLQLSLGATCLKKQILVHRVREGELFHSPLHGKRAFQKKKGKPLQIETRLEKNTFVPDEIIKGFATLNASQSDRAVKSVEVKLIQEIIFPEKVRRISLKQNFGYRAEAITELASVTLDGVAAYSEKPELLVFKFDLSKLLTMDQGLFFQASRKGQQFICQYLIRITPIFKGSSLESISLPIYLYEQNRRQIGLDTLESDFLGVTSHQIESSELSDFDAPAARQELLRDFRQGRKELVK